MPPLSRRGRFQPQVTSQHCGLHLELGQSIGICRKHGQAPFVRLPGSRADDSMQFIPRQMKGRYRTHRQTSDLGQVEVANQRHRHPSSFDHQQKPPASHRVRNTFGLPPGHSTISTCSPRHYKPLAAPTRPQWFDGKRFRRRTWATDNCKRKGHVVCDRQFKQVPQTCSSAADGSAIWMSRPVRVWINLLPSDFIQQ